MTVHLADVDGVFDGVLFCAVLFPTRSLPVPGRPTILITVGQGHIALAVGAGGGGLDIFTLIYPFFSFSLSLGDGLI